MATRKPRVALYGHEIVGGDLSPYVTSLDVLNQLRRPWSTINASLAIPVAKWQSLLPQPGDWLVVYDDDGYSIAMGYVDSVRTGLRAGNDGEHQTEQVNVSTISWLELLGRTRVVVAFAWQTESVGTLYRGSDWYQQWKTLIGASKGDLGEALESSLTALAAVRFPRKIGGGRRIGDAVSVVHSQYTSDVLAGGAYSVEPVHGLSLRGLSAPWQDSTVLDLLLHTFQADDSMVEMFPAFGARTGLRVEEREWSSVDPDAVIMEPILVYRLRPWLAGPLGGVNARAMEVGQRPTWPEPIKAPEQHRISIQWSDGNRSNVATADIPNAGQPVIKWWEAAAVPVADRKGIMQHGLRVLDVKWPFYPPPDQQMRSEGTIVKSISAIAELAATLHLRGERFASGSCTGPYLTAVRPGQSFVTPIERAPWDGSLTAYAESVKHRWQVKPGGAIHVETEIGYTRGLLYEGARHAEITSTKIKVPVSGLHEPSRPVAPGDERKGFA